MGKKICIFGESLCFNASNALEEYRIQSALSKEPETISWINDWEIQNMESPVFFDIGANIGIYSLYANHKHPKVNVYAFEPVSNNYTALQKNVRLNKSTNIHPFNLALADSFRIVNLYLSDTRVGNSGAQIGQAINEKGELFAALRVEKILSVSLDSLIYEIGFPVPTYVKIDVDGHETDILKGMTRVLAEPSLLSLLVEFNSDNDFFFWHYRLEQFGLHVDSRYDDLPAHSRIRRVSNGILARNYIFRRSDKPCVPMTLPIY